MTASPQPAPDDPTIALLDGLERLRGQLPPDRARQAEILLKGRKNLEHLPTDASESYRIAIERFCKLNGLDEVLLDAGVIHPYDIRSGFPQEPHGPRPTPERPFATKAWSLLGQRIGFPIGVPASVLTQDERWVGYFARHGFNVLTFKTVRSREAAPNPFPNWVFLEDHDAPLPLGVDPEQVVVHGSSSTYLRHLRAFSMANSFGVPSFPPDVWMPEVRAAVDGLADGQLLIVSVMGSNAPGDPPGALRDDFVRVARMAHEAGAPAIELNLSCPNTLNPGAEDSGGVKPPLCASVADAVEVVRAVREAIGADIPLVAKLGYLPEPDLRPLVHELNPYVDAFSGINTLQVWVEDGIDGSATFGEREKAGLSGIAIRHLAIDFVRSLKRLRDCDPELDYEIIAMGGVMDAADVYALLAVGADAVQTATAASVNPRLAREAVDIMGEDPRRDAEVVDQVRRTLYADDGGFRSPAELAELLDMDCNAVERQLNPLGELDLPRRVFELIGLGRAHEQQTVELDEDVWGSPPSAERVRASKRNQSRLLAQREQRLVRRAATVEEFARLLGWTVEQVAATVKAREVVSFAASAGHTVLPLWQIVERPDSAAELLPGLAELQRAFGRDVPALDAWITARNASLGGRVPSEVLAEGDVDSVLRSVEALAAGL